MKIGLIGQGVMGKGIVQILAQTESVSSILWVGRTLDKCKTSFTELEKQWKRMIAKKKLSEDNMFYYINKISLIDDYSLLSNVNCVIEAVPEKMETKREIFTKISHVVKDNTIVASNTSSLSITELASLSKKPENVIGLHFFNPATVMKLTEVIIGLTTSQDTINWAVDFVKKLNKEPVIVNEAPGFIVNRMLIPMINEAIGILAEGVANAEEIDKAMKLGANHPVGPLSLADLIGNDINLSIMENLHNETGDPKYRAHPLLRKMVRANKLGRKTGCGFFKY
ncbi:3-hydroxyacyl-CoA dehydrogenase family protein [Photorhabdus hindustanensis]|uniref:3-hydroxybutyryl-CoA dehydrogenase n=1 Tax=Photorhabdus hindustanensis TaxID=2918802 RepID=A0A2S8Q872_9GAMM|nr:3-hydroxyacyl-CoA dehydrogenase NAD-binding domain-containing protein [Photorhabdus hindustanensis]PQQ29161.1 3-hydroxybutyryl-CoA dehydrogenase [Photorhabdus hindustanensis]